MIKLSYKINKYRQQLFETIKNGDAIIEIGCHVGKTTKKIIENFENCQIIAIDNSPEAITPMKKLEKEYENLENDEKFNIYIRGCTLT